MGSVIGIQIKDKDDSSFIDFNGIQVFNSGGTFENLIKHFLRFVIALYVPASFYVVIDLIGINDRSRKGNGILCAFQSVLLFILKINASAYPSHYRTKNERYTYKHKYHPGSGGFLQVFFPFFYLDKLIFGERSLSPYSRIYDLFLFFRDKTKDK